VSAPKFAAILSFSAAVYLVTVPARVTGYGKNAFNRGGRTALTAIDFCLIIIVK